MIFTKVCRLPAKSGKINSDRTCRNRAETQKKTHLGPTPVFQVRTGSFREEENPINYIQPFSAMKPCHPAPVPSLRYLIDWHCWLAMLYAAQLGVVRHHSLQVLKDGPAQRPTKKVNLCLDAFPLHMSGYGYCSKVDFR